MARAPKFEPISNDKPPGWDANFIVHATYSIIDGKIKKSGHRIYFGANVSTYIGIALNSPSDVHEHYANGSFPMPVEPDFEYMDEDIDIPIRSFCYVLVEFDSDSEIVLDHKAKSPVSTNVEREFTHSGLRFIDIDGSNVGVRKTCPKDCRMFFFANTGLMNPKTHHQIQIRLKPPKGFRPRDDNTLLPDVPNDGGRPVPPGRRWTLSFDGKRVP